MSWIGWLRREARLSRAAAGIGDPVSRLRFLQTASPSMPVAGRRPAVRLPRAVLWASLPLVLLVPLLMRLAAGRSAPPAAASIPVRWAPSAKTAQNVAVWQVERTAESETYSNGLRIDTRFTVHNRPRAYTAFQKNGSAGIARVRRSEPAGIVYHTTESCQAPFVELDTPVLTRLGKNLLEYVRLKRAYHYLIDRFGRVYRIVAESDSADHAGYSVWADDREFYINLNESFLGVSFEAQTTSIQAGAAASQAQIRAAAMLTEMLRSRYRIPAGNCVTHAQVSVNPANMLVGYHTDWAGGFPFAGVRLAGQLPARASVPLGFRIRLRTCLVGFHGGMSPGVRLAEDILAHDAAAAHMRPVSYRKALRERYRVWLAEIRRTGSPPAAQLRLRLRRPVAVLPQHFPRGFHRIGQHIKERARAHPLENESAAILVGFYAVIHTRCAENGFQTQRLVQSLGDIYQHGILTFKKRRFLAHFS